MPTDFQKGLAPPSTGLPDLPAQTYQPLGFLAVIKVARMTKTRGGLDLPDHLQKDQVSDELRRGVVVAAGAQCRYLRRGDAVLLLPSARVFWHKHRGEELVVCAEDQVVGIENNWTGQMPNFFVADWQAGEVERSDPRPAGNIATGGFGSDEDAE